MSSLVHLSSHSAKGVRLGLYSPLAFRLTSCIRLMLCRDVE
jgi:hypothetical protein